MGNYCVNRVYDREIYKNSNILNSKFQFVATLSFRPKGEIALVGRQRLAIFCAELLVRFLPSVEMTNKEMFLEL
jgi:hypothetical protein